MRLRLRGDEAGAGLSGRFVLDEGELTIGRDPACHLVVDDPARTVSGVHCRIKRDALGYVLVDESTNGVSVDGRELAEKESVRLADGSAIAFCGFRLTAEIGGEAEPDWSAPDASLAIADDLPSISAILADVAPAGRTATGILPARLDEDWMEAASRPAPAGTERISRPDIGWKGPPEPSVLQPAIPDDWHLGDTEFSSRSEHVSATQTRVRLPRGPAAPTPIPVPAPAGDGAEDAAGAFLAGLGRMGEGARAEPLAWLRAKGAQMGRLLDAEAATLRRLGDLRDALGLDPLPPGTDAAAELERLVAAVEALLADVARLHPSRIEALAGSGARRGFRLGWGDAGRTHAAIYREAFLDEEGRGPAERFAARLAVEPAEQAPDETFESLTPDRASTMTKGAGR